MWDVEYTDEFYQWWRTLTEEQQEALDDRLILLAEHGPPSTYTDGRSPATDDLYDTYLQGLRDEGLLAD